MTLCVAHPLRKLYIPLPAGQTLQCVNGHKLYTVQLDSCFKKYITRLPYDLQWQKKEV